MNLTEWDWTEDPAQGVPCITARQERESWIFGTPRHCTFVTLIPICFYLIYSLLGYDFGSSAHMPRAVSQDHVWHGFLVSSPHFHLLHTFILLGQLFYQCQGPSHGGSYMDEGTSHIRIRLLPVIVPGDCLASLSYSMLHCLLVHVQCPMIQGCTSTSPPSLLIHVCAPGWWKVKASEGETQSR